MENELIDSKEIMALLNINRNQLFRIKWLPEVAARVGANHMKVYNRQEVMAAIERQNNKVYTGFIKPVRFLEASKKLIEQIVAGKHVI